MEVVKKTTSPQIIIKFKIALGELATVLGSNANAKKSFEIECIYNFVNLNNFNSTSKVSLYSLL